MHPLLERILQEAKKNKRKVVLPESTDVRMLTAARKATDEGVADIVLVGVPAQIEAAAKENNIALDGIEIVDHINDDLRQDYVETYTEFRKHRGMTVEKAQTIMEDPLYYAAMMTKKGRVDGMVAGAVNTSGNVIRATIQIVKTAPGIRTISSCFLMLVPDCPYGEQGGLIYSDCGSVINPDENQLADIAIASSKSCKALMGVEPKVAMLSFSTKGSAQHDMVDKVVNATKIVKEKAPELKIDGELQGDAALIESIAKKKAPESEVAGNANVLIFPDLQAGNIAYKLTERLAKATALGPLLQGSALPVNDLSRGCNAEDIFKVIAITVVEANID